MAAGVDSQHFFLKRKKLFLVIFRHIRKGYARVKRLFAFSPAEIIKQRHLPRELALSLSCSRVKYLAVYQHHLSPVSSKGVKCACLDKVLGGSLIDL